ncbi:MAG: vitamin K epoxide reductase family protein [Armatimonadetes bacterium]|nr:vitamin K epoxide reductase family protein [Armatimonadota bacterium]
MKALLWNRVLLILAFIGIFIAGTLSLSHLFDLQLPCGAEHGCDKVTTSANSFLFGVPVAYFGLLTYLVLAGLAIIRTLKGRPYNERLIQLGFWLSLFGAAFSAYLQYVSFTVIQAKCWWCISSAVVMIVTLIGYGFLVQSLNEKVEEVQPQQSSGLGLVVVLSILALGGIMGEKMYTESLGRPHLIVNPDNVPYTDFVPEGAHTKGVENPKATIVLFGDLTCPPCRLHFPDIYKTTTVGGSLKLVFRHEPLFKLAGHELALKAAMISEIAAEKGKFWEYVKAIYSVSQEGQPEDVLYKYAADVGLNPGEVKQRVENYQNDPAFLRVKRDMDFAERIGIHSTPTLVIIADGFPTKAVGYKDFVATMQQDDFIKYLGLDVKN